MHFLWTILFDFRNYTTLWARSVGGRNLGLVFTDGQFYWNQKHFAVKHLKNFGFGKTSLQTVIVDQANDLTSFLEKQSVNRNVEISNEVFATPVVNVLWSMMAGCKTKKTIPQIICKIVNGLSMFSAFHGVKNHFFRPKTDENHFFKPSQGAPS